jgi:hypothetical protein
LCGAVEFKLGDCDKENAVLSSRQKISLPEKAKKLYLLAAEIGSDREEVFEVGMNTVKKKIAAMNEKVFGWDLYDMKETAFTKDVKTALEFTHAHRCGKDEIAKQSYFFVYEFDVENAEYFTLPKSMNMLVLAATVSTENDSAVLLSEYADKIENRKFTYSIPKYDRKSYRKYKIISYFAR